MQAPQRDRLAGHRRIRIRAGVLGSGRFSARTACHDAADLRARLLRNVNLRLVQGTLRQYHFPRAKPPNAMSPTKAMMSPIQKLQMIMSTTPTMTRMPPRPIPPVFPLLRSAAIPLRPFRRKVTKTTQAVDVGLP